MNDTGLIAATVAKRTMVAHNTYELLIRPARPVSFSPGQYISVTIPNVKASPTETRSRDLSLTTSPSEALLGVAFRDSSSAFKQSLLDPQTPELVLRGPHGIFKLLPSSTTPLVFIAGGIGITPFMSVIRHAALHRHPIKAHMLRLESDPSRSAYDEELHRITTTNPGLKITGHIGRVTTAAELQALIPALTPDSQVYIAGPVGMTGRTRALVRELGVHPLSIHLEEFTSLYEYDE